MTDRILTEKFLPERAFAETFKNTGDGIRPENIDYALASVIMARAVK